MRKIYQFEILNPDEFRKHLIGWAQKFDIFVILDSNREQVTEPKTLKYSSYNIIVGAGSLSQTETSGNTLPHLKKFVNETHDWMFGHISYEANHALEGINSVKPDFINFPKIFLYKPKWVLTINGTTAKLHYPEELSQSDAENVKNSIMQSEISDNSPYNHNKIRCRVSKKKYLEIIDKLKYHISRGDIYEINYCIDFFAKNYKINPYTTYLKLNSYSPAPFSAFYKYYDKFLLCSSPERFIKKLGNKLISQPVKGTVTRSNNTLEDTKLSDSLKVNHKERAENIMITDLVRNDLSRSAIPGSVHVEELCEIYSFRHVHQMISTIACELDKNTHFIDAIKNAFPMGSMTGAPKISAMKLIDKYEYIQRGLFSGSVGYISPDNDFDFNVIIRSILYNSTANYLSISAGSAITAYCTAEKEYEECLLKANALLNVLNMK